MSRGGSARPETDHVGAIVHELRGPLTVIRGQVQLARGQIGRDPARERAAIDSAIAQVDRMALLITELLDGIRLASDGFSLSMGVFDLSRALLDAVAWHQYDSQPAINLQQPVQGSVPVRGDPKRIAQILDNVLEADRSNGFRRAVSGAPICHFDRPQARDDGRRTSIADR